jgi:TRAP-type C4-dicarboxylate transport system substrate-binding protein
MAGGFSRATLILLCAGASAHAEPRVLRLASISPDGTGYAREMRAFAREVESETNRLVRIKLYFGGIAGDELEMVERIRKGQLDGAASAGMACERIAPSTRVMRVPGLFDSREQATRVLGRVKALLDPEFEKAGYVNLGMVMIGPAILFSRDRMRDLDEVRRHRFWVWDADQMMARLFPLFGLQTLPLPVNEAARAYDEGRHDGFTAPPSGALAFQWSSRARYYYPDLVLSYLTGCMVVSHTAWDALDEDSRNVIRAAAAKASARVDEVGKQLDHQLLSGLFKKQGLVEVPINARFRAQYDETARTARIELEKKEVPAALVEKVQQMVSKEHASGDR